MPIEARIAIEAANAAIEALERIAAAGLVSAFFIAVFHAALLAYLLRRKL